MSIFRGRSVDEVIPQIQSELGADAIIVRRREGLTGGILGFFQHPFVEIEALPGPPGIDVYDEPDSVAPPPPTPPAQPPPSTQAPPPARPPVYQQPPATFTPTGPPQGAPVSPGAAATPAAPPAHPVSPPPFYARDPAAPAIGSAYVTAHLAALARAGPRTPIPERRRDPLVRPIDFQELLSRDVQPPQPAPRARADYSFEPPVPPRAPVRQAPMERRAVAPGSQGRARAGVEKSLLRAGFSEEMAGELIDGASAHMLPFAPRSGLAHAVRLALAQRIPVAKPLPNSEVALVVVGAGGAGKTTSCAALLSAYRKAGTLPASCATLLRTPELAMILSPQILKATPLNTPRALRALRKARDEGLAVIDTPPLSSADRAGVRELAGVLGELKPERVLVALPATLSASAAAQLLAALEPLGADAVVLTHAQETDQIGVAVEAACRFGLAPEYMLDRARSGGWRLTRVDPTGLAARLLQ